MVDVGRLRIISGGMILLAGLFMFALNLLTEFSDQMVVGGTACLIVGFGVMWYNIPKEKRGGF